MFVGDIDFSTYHLWKDQSLSARILDGLNRLERQGNQNSYVSFIV